LELGCGLEDQVLQFDMTAGQVVHVVVDSDAGFGAATVSVTLLP